MKLLAAARAPATAISPPRALRPRGHRLIDGGRNVPYVAALRARRLGLDEARFAVLTLVTVLAGLAAAHVVAIVAYHPREALAHPSELLRFLLLATGIAILRARIPRKGPSCPRKPPPLSKVHSDGGCDP